MADTYYEEKVDKLVDYAEKTANQKDIYDIEDLKDKIYTEQIENNNQIDLYLNEKK